MRKLINCSLIAILFSIVFPMDGMCQLPGMGEGSNVGDLRLVNIGKSKVELHIYTENHVSKAFLIFSNTSNSTLWFPFESSPAYRSDEKSRRMKIWFGYFDEVYGAHYMLPMMQPVKPGEKFKFELAGRSLVHELSKVGMKTSIQVRVATKAFTQSRVRNNQPIDDYVNNSIVLEAVNSGIEK